MIWMFPKIGEFPPKWMVKIMENPLKMDDLGVRMLIFGSQKHLQRFYRMRSPLRLVFVQAKTVKNGKFSQ